MDAFTSFLEEHRDERICMITPGGNHGDTLIHMGAAKKLGEVGARYVSLNLEEEYRRSLALGAKYLLNIAAWKLGLRAGFKLLDIPTDTGLILFEGGGYMSDIWYGPVLLNQVTRRHKKPIAVGPQSYLFTRTDLGAMLDDRPVTLFCRETRSYQHLADMELPPNVEVRVSPDTALYLEPGDLEGLIMDSSDSYDLVSFRNDRESMVSPTLRGEVIGGAVNPRVGDISKRGEMSDFVSAVANADRVFTDRLHVAILAYILGKETTLFGNTYHKSLGVWEYSLRDRVRFVELSEPVLNNDVELD